MKGFRGLPAVIVHNRDCCYMYEGEGGGGGGRGGDLRGGWGSGHDERLAIFGLSVTVCTVHAELVSIRTHFNYQIVSKFLVLRPKMRDEDEDNQ